MLTKSTHSPQTLSTAFERRAKQCADALTEARRLIAIRSYGAPLNQVIGRTYDLFDEIDDILVRLQAANDREAFARVTALHRQFEAIQSLIPRTRGGN